MTNPKSFQYVDQFGALIDWSNYIGKVCPLITGHNRPASEREVSDAAMAKARENNLVRSLRCMRYSGETTKARALVASILD